MKVAVIGVGHVGLVTASTMAKIGHDVVGYDVDERKVASLREGVVPFHEPGLQELFVQGMEQGRITVTTDAAEAVRDVEVVFICVGTPRNPDGSPNLTYVQAAAATVSTHASRPTVVVEKSTVPVQTGERIRQALALQAQSRGETVTHSVVSNPEFLKEKGLPTPPWIDRAPASIPGVYEDE